ncbi:MAG TPA: hypothetical protein VF235_01395 [Actinomycetota bacterium]
MASAEDRPAVFLIFAGVAIGILALVLPLYALAEGSHGWFLAQLEGAPVRVRVAFALPSIGLLVVAVAAAASISARTSRKVAAGVLLGLGAVAALTAVSRVLGATGIDGQGWILIALTALQAAAYLTGGLLVARSRPSR